VLLRSDEWCYCAVMSGATAQSRTHVASRVAIVEESGHSKVNQRRDLTLICQLLFGWHWQSTLVWNYSERLD